MSAGSIAQLTASYEAGRHNVRGEIERQVERLEQLNPTYHAFDEVSSSLPLEAARLDHELRQGRRRSAIHGVPISVQSAIATGARRTEIDNGANSLDTPLVRTLRQAGAAIVGTTTAGPIDGRVDDAQRARAALNPWQSDLVVFGASAGAGVAASLGLGLLHLGPDAAGCVLKAAARCGAVGFVPSADALADTDGAVDERLGLLARSVDDIRRGFRVLCKPGHDVHLPPRLLVPVDLVHRMGDAATRAQFAAVLAWLESVGWMLVTGEIEGWADTTAKDGAGRGAAERFRAAVPTALARCGASAVFTPSTTSSAPDLRPAGTVGAKSSVRCTGHGTLLTHAAHDTGGVAISLPVGDYRETGLPFGVQLLAPKDQDHALVDLADRLEADLGSALPPPTTGGAPAGG